MPRPHKADCQCAICKKIRAKAAREAVIPVEISPIIVKAPVVAEVQLSTLPIGALFMLGGKKCRVADKTPECVVCHSLQFFDAGPLPTDKGWTIDKMMSLAIFTLVLPIK